jgi:hypothetical protein
MNGFHKFSKLQPGIGLPSFLPKSIGPYLPSALSRLYGQLSTGRGGGFIPGRNESCTCLDEHYGFFRSLPMLSAFLRASNEALSVVFLTF